MIPENLVEFLNGPLVLSVGTRNEEMRPCLSRVFGVVTDAENDTITVFLPDVTGEPTLDNLNRNGRAALTACEGISHETYQFKGRTIGSRPSNEKETALQDDYKSKMISHYNKKGVPEVFFGGFVYHPSTAVTFQVEEIFIQTPGPGAGDKIDFTPKP